MLANENVSSVWDTGNYTCRRAKSDTNALIFIRPSACLVPNYLSFWIKKGGLFNAPRPEPYVQTEELFYFMDPY